MFPLTIAELSKQESRSGFDEDHQNSAKHSPERVWLDPSEQLEQLAAQGHALTWALASDSSKTADQGKLWSQDQSPQSWKHKTEG